MAVYLGSHSPEKALHPQGPFAHFWRAAYRANGAWFNTNKLEAHRQEVPAWSPSELVHIRGNAHADKRAKAAALRRRLSYEQLEAVNSALEEHTQYLAALGPTLAKWPRLREILGQLDKRPKPDKPRPFVEEHMPVWQGEKQ